MAAARDIGRGDADVVAGATHELYNRYGRQIYAYCLHQLSSREEAEDAVQTTFLNAFRGLQRGTVAHCEQAWLFKIAHNVCLSRQTSSWRRRRVESPNDFEVLQEIIPSPPRSGAEELIGLEEALEAMPENQRRAILLREWQGLSYREIGAELELSQASVEMLIFRARRSLAAALEPARKEEAPLAGQRLDLGALLAGLKSALTGGAAVKVVLAAAAASTVGVAVQPVERTLVRRTAVHRAAAARAPAVTPVAAAVAVREAAAGSRMGVPAAASARRAHISVRVVRTAPVTSSRTHALFDQSPASEAAPAPADAPAPAAPAPAPAPAPAASAAPAVAAPVEPVRTSATVTTQQPLATTPPPAPTSTVATPPPAPPGNSGNRVGNANTKSNGHGNAFGRATPLRAAPVPPVPVAPVPPAAPVAPAPVAPGNNGNGRSDGHGNAFGHATPLQAAPVLPVPVAPAPPAEPVAPAPVAPGNNGNGRSNGHGNAFGRATPLPAAPVPPAPVPPVPVAPAPPAEPVPPAPAAPGNNGNGNGKANGRQDPPPAGAPAPVPVTTVPPQQAVPPAPAPDATHGNGNGNGKGKGH